MGSFADRLIAPAPVSTANYVAYHAPGDTMLKSNLLLRFTSSSIAPTNIFDLSPCQFGLGVVFSTSRPSLANHVGAIVCRRPYKEMSRIAAGAIVTAMEDSQPFRDRATGNLACKAVSVGRSPGGVEPPISHVGAGLPWPAFIGALDIHEGPKASHQGDGMSGIARSGGKKCGILRMHDNLLTGCCVMPPVADNNAGAFSHPIIPLGQAGCKWVRGVVAA